MNISKSLTVDDTLHAFVEGELLPGTGVASDAFWAALEKVLAQADRVYLTIDLDVLPASEMPAVSAPAALGIPALDLLPVIEQICRSGKLQAADLVEFNPQYDRDGQGAKLAARLAWQIAHWWA